MSKITSLTAEARDGTHWHIQPDWQDVLLGPGGLRLEEWRAAGLTQVVKHGAHRTVYRIDLPQKSFYLKHYRTRRRFDGCRAWFRASAPRREWAKALALAARKIPTITPVAWGERHRRGLLLDSYLITESLEPTESLAAFAQHILPKLPPDAQRRVRRRILVALARLCADAHRAGVFHTDFHPGNLLIDVALAGDDECELQLYLIDVPDVELSAALDWRRSSASLAALAFSMRAYSTSRERVVFLRAYLRMRPDLNIIDVSAAACRIHAAAWRIGQRIMRGRDKRSRRNNSDFYRRDVAGWRRHAVRDLTAEDLDRLLADPAEFLAQHLVCPVKLGRRSVLVQAHLPCAGVPKPILFKRVRTSNWWKSLLGRFRSSRAMKSWQRGHALFSRGINTARPLAVCEPQGGLLRREAYLATEFLPDAVNLHQYIWQLAEGDRTQAAQRVAIVLGSLVGRLHAWQIAHCDLKGANALISEHDGALQAYLVDVDGVRIYRKLPHRRRIEDLARLAVSMAAYEWINRGMLLRFLQAYCAEQPEVVRWKTLWPHVSRRAGTLLAKKRARGDAIL